ncbi:hypothetical protein [Mycobacterium sp. RTGN5]|uniref:hypothetical protein n=1 Tax=Mycobacterium sp. RTGN5 TaxID=3016522 RepID=UPI0029C689C7|nr:hypothetical protein [Mycobacterium sp. RTGN5]
MVSAVLVALGPLPTLVDLTVDGEPLALLLGEEAVSEPVSSAWAMQDPLAMAAPRPRVSAPAPSQVYASARCGLA